MITSVIDTLMQPNAVRIEFQPIVTVTRDRVELYALEALSRGPKGTPLADAVVLFDRARSEGAENEVDLICIAEALTAAATLPGEPCISINVHGSTICNTPQFARSALALALRLGIDPARIIFEIIEHRDRWDMAAFRHEVSELRRASVRIALDDLGSGASNYRMFIDCAPDHLKIDRYLVTGCSGDAVRTAVLRSIVSMARECGVIPVAEGIESRADLERVVDLGIRHVQGWLYARSMPPWQAAQSDFLNPQLMNERAM